MAEQPIEPIHQFRITNLFDIGTFGGNGTEGSGTHLAFTNSALFMVLTVGLILAFLILGSNRRAIIPGRMQLMAEMTYEFVANMVRDTTGTEGMKFFPLVASLFLFVLVANLFGMFPYFFTVTSHLIVTVMLALIVFLTVVIYGFYKNGPRFLKVFVPSGIPWYIIWIVVPIEVLSFLSRPVSHSLRLWGNVLAGHIVLKVFGGMVVALLAAGAWGVVSILPFGMAVAMTGLEVLVAALQAFVFAVLTCVYLHDAMHPGH
ncbi:MULTISPECIES: F0F1 ATP synthase subunit A [unclassified Devosia]|uniref:F0F1 ATP synthase subunit A n=1 Tax=unclassified Devosia TaxID=196773 RepID=UPI000B2E86BE|nr:MULTISPECIES: F0F1 ATP synthase subunit A [unclassified Devosia]